MTTTRTVVFKDFDPSNNLHASIEREPPQRSSYFLVEEPAPGSNRNAKVVSIVPGECTPKPSVSKLTVPHAPRPGDGIAEAIRVLNREPRNLFLEVA